MAHPAHALVPLDGSELSMAVLAVLPDLRPARVSLLRVIDPKPYTDTAERAAAETQDLAEIAERVKGLCACDAPGVVRQGDPAQEILAAASELAVDLIAMTTHGRSGFDRLVLGSIAERVIRASPAPLLVLRRTEPQAPPGSLFGRVLLPHDGSELAGRAIDALARICDPQKTPLTLLGLVEDALGQIEAAEGNLPAPMLGVNFEYGHRAARELTKHRREVLNRLLEREAARARELGFEVAVEVAVGEIAPMIIERAASLPATLLAVATHGRSGLSLWTLGSVTEKVLRAATLPLLVCR